MSLRLRCPNCQATFVTNDAVGQTVTCPKCDAPQVVAAPGPPSTGPADPPPLSRIEAPAAPAPSTANDAGGSTFLPKDKRAKAAGPGKSRAGLWVAASSIAALAAGVLIAWPSISRWWDPRPRTMVEGAAYDYLQALAKGDSEAAGRIGVVAEPPAIRSFRDLERDDAANDRVKGSFAPIARLHRSIETKFVYDPNNGRFTPKDPLGPAAETLDALHDAKAKAEKDGTYRKMASGDPEEQMQAAIDFGGVFTRLSEGILSPKRLIPSYKSLVRGAKPPLTGPELALALDYATHREVWDALLKRPFPTLKADGPFQFEKAELTAGVVDKLGSAGDPPSTLRLRLVRFRMDSIDTGWRVVAARRVAPGGKFEPEVEEEPAPETPADPPRPSPGESPAGPGLIPGDSPGR